MLSPLIISLGKYLNNNFPSRFGTYIYTIFSNTKGQIIIQQLFPGPRQHHRTLYTHSVFSRFFQYIPRQLRLLIITSITEIGFRRPHMCRIGHRESTLFRNSEIRTAQFSTLFGIQPV